MVPKADVQPAKKFSRRIANLSRYVNVILSIFLAINLLSLIIYQLTSIKSDFYHEAAFPYLYAQSDLDQKTIFNYNFSGREIAPISWPLVVHFLFLLGFELNFLTVAVSNFVFLGFCISVILWFGKIFGLTKTQVLLVLCLFTIPFGSRPFRYSWFDQVWIWPMNSYGLYETFSLVLCILTLKMLKSEKSLPSLTIFVSSNVKYLAVFFLLGLNHNRGFFQIYGPVAFALLLALAINTSIEVTKRRRVILTLLSTAAFTLLGRVTIGILTQGVPQYWQEASQNFSELNYDNLVDKLFAPVLTIFQVFGVNPQQGQPVISYYGISLLSLFFLVIILVFVPTFKFLRPDRYGELSLEGKLMFGHLLYFILISFMTSIFTSTAGVVRYSIPLAISAIFFSPFILQQRAWKIDYSVILIIALIAPSVAVGAHKLVVNPPVSYKESSNYKLTQSLLERDLLYGYAGPWTEDVMVIPFYSGGQIHVSLIDVNPIGPHLHADKTWFLESDHSGRTFVAFPTEIVLRNEKLAKLVKASVANFVVDKWTVLIYRENPAKLIGQLP